MKTHSIPRIFVFFCLRPSFDKQPPEIGEIRLWLLGVNYRGNRSGKGRSYHNMSSKLFEGSTKYYNYLN